MRVQEVWGREEAGGSLGLEVKDWLSSTLMPVTWPAWVELFLFSGTRGFEDSVLRYWPQYQAGHTVTLPSPTAVDLSLLCGWDKR